MQLRTAMRTANTHFPLTVALAPTPRACECQPKFQKETPPYKFIKTYRPCDMRALLGFLLVAPASCRRLSAQPSRSKFAQDPSSPFGAAPRVAMNLSRGFHSAYTLQ